MITYLLTVRLAAALRYVRLLVVLLAVLLLAADCWIVDTDFTPGD